MAAAGGDQAATFHCSVCNTPKRFNHPTWKTKPGSDTFCNVCGTKQYHKNHDVQPRPPAGQPYAPPPAVPPAAAASPSPAAPPPTSFQPPISVTPASGSPFAQPPVPAPSPAAAAPPPGFGRPPAAQPTAAPHHHPAAAAAAAPIPGQPVRPPYGGAPLSVLGQPGAAPPAGAHPFPGAPAAPPAGVGVPPQPGAASAVLPVVQPVPGAPGQPPAPAPGQPGQPAPVPAAAAAAPGVAAPQPADAGQPGQPGVAPAAQPPAGGGAGGPAAAGAPAADAAAAEPVQLADGTTSVSGLEDEDSTLRRANRTMEEELKKMDEALKLLRQQVPDTSAPEKKDEEKDDGKGNGKGKDDKGKDKDAKAGKEDKKAAAAAAAAAADPSIPYPELGLRVDASLWPVLLERLAACGLNEGDVATCTPLTFEKVLLYLAFNPLERARLMQEFTAKHGANTSATAPKPQKEDKPEPVKPPIMHEETPSEVGIEATPLDILGPPTGATVPYAGQLAYETQTNLKNEPLLIDPSHLHRWPNWKAPGWPSEPSAQPPSESNFDEEGFDPILKCAAHPERPIEFWCVNCESLVCTMCHITGFHKDHPFMPLSEAARKECGGLQDWQMRAGTISSKLDDTKVALDEVHQNIDDYHQQQIDTVVTTIDALKAELEGHKDGLIKRMQGHAAAQHQLFHAPAERIRQLKHTLGKVASKIDNYLTANPDNMLPEDTQRWSQGIMNVRSVIATAFADAANHPIVVPNYTNLKYNNELLPEDLFGKLFLVKNPAPVGMSSYLEMRDLQHPLFASKDRINFSWAQPAGGAGQETATNGPPDAHPTGELQGHSPITLNNNNLTASYAGAGSGHALFKATATFEAGKHYWEVRLDALHNDNRLGTHAIVGLVEEGSDSMGSQTGLAWCVDKLSGVVPMALDCPPWTPGSLLGIFLDLDMDRVGLYFNKECVAHLAIPHGRYTPSASIHCYHDQVTLIPQADIPPGVSLTSGLANRDTAYRLTVPGRAAPTGTALAPLNLSAIDTAPDPEVSYLQDECLKLRQHVQDVKRDIVEQQRVQAQQSFQEQQIKDLKSMIDGTAAQMANQTLEFERQAADDLRKLQDYQRQQLEDETKRVLQMQAETSARATEVEEARARQQDQSGRLERFLIDQQVQLTQQMLDRQKQKDAEIAMQQQTAALREAARKAYEQQQLVAQQSVPPPPPSHTAMRLPPQHPAAPLTQTPNALYSQPYSTKPFSPFSQ